MLQPIVEDTVLDDRPRRVLFQGESPFLRTNVRPHSKSEDLQLEWPTRDCTMCSHRQAMTLEHNLCSRVYWGGRRPSMDGHLNRVGGHNSRPPIHGLKRQGPQWEPP